MPISSETLLPLHAEQVYLQFSVALLLCPEIEGEGGQLIHHRDRPPILRHVNGFYVAVASIAGVHADIVDVIGHKDRQLVFVFFAAVRALYPEESPFGGTEGAYQ